MALAAVDRKAITGWSNRELTRRMRMLSDEWQAIGRPHVDAMPNYMLVLKVAYDAEKRRRGEQLELF